MTPEHSLLDQVLTEMDVALRVLTTPGRAARPSPARASPPTHAAPTPATTAAVEPPADVAAREAAALMRVNHAGEVSAQALYRGQALVARDPVLKAELLAAADEENDHLAWCAERVQDLGSHVSRLNPVWYAGSFAIGVLAGLGGDRWSLGFLAETERQVTRHLEGHLARLPAGDGPSRRIVMQMREDEQAHAANAQARGAAPLPRPLREAMGLASRVMTTLAHRI